MKFAEECPIFDASDLDLFLLRRRRHARSVRSIVEGNRASWLTPDKVHDLALLLQRFVASQWVHFEIFGLGALFEREEALAPLTSA